MPSASAAKVRQRPSADSIPALLAQTWNLGVLSTVTPPASARSQLPARRLSQAVWTATSDDEQAVSIVRQGPLRFR